MDNASVPETDYRHTSRRRPWDSLPEAVRAHLARQVGGQVASVELAGGGFTHGFAGIVHGSSGGRVFAKAAPSVDTLIHPAYVRESRVVPLLPAGMPSPQLLAAGDIEDDDGCHWQLLVYEAVDGRMPGRPWTGEDLAAVEAACTVSARLLSGFPAALAGTPVAEDLAAVPGVFGRIADGGAPPWFLPDLSAEQARRFRDLLAFSPEALAGNAVLHGDLRPDNILVGSGTAVFCDWNFLGTGAAWIDWVGVLPYARGGGMDVEAWLKRSALTRDIPADHIDAFLAALLAYMINSGCSPEVEASPHLRSHGRHTARLVYDWAAARWSDKGHLALRQ